MDLKRLITHFTYRIEAKPEGGFIAHSTDPTVAPLEAATREELQQKIQANIAAALAAEFPGLKLPLQDKELKCSFHVELKPGGGFAIHSSDPNAKPIHGATQEEIENHFAEKLVGFMGKHFMPELAQALAAQGNAGDIKIFVNRKVSATTPAEGSLQLNNAKIEDWRLVNAKTASGDLSTAGIANSPITPEASGSWSVFRLLLALLIIAALFYFFFHR